MEFIELIKVPKVDNVTMRRNALPTVEGGTLCITSHHLILSSRKDGEEELWVSAKYNKDIIAFFSEGLAEHVFFVDSCCIGILIWLNGSL